MRVLQILSGVVFVIAGALCLVGPPRVVQQFDRIGVGQWFRYVTGLLEITGAFWMLAGLRFPRMAFYGAFLLVCVMAGAIVAQLTVLGGSPVAAITMLLLNAGIAWLRRSAI